MLSILLYLLPALLTYFPGTFIIKENANNGRSPPSAFPVLAFIKEEATRCINEEAIGAIYKAIMGSIISPINPLFLSRILQVQ